MHRGQGDGLVGDQAGALRVDPPRLQRRQGHRQPGRHRQGLGDQVLRPPQRHHQRDRQLRRGG
ncbi:hypothetical protein WDV85_14910, partial [Pseudokineococcus sp. 5B2Z-1]|uniref:hypothetical protein n=1 Tax=Pseudokineococcus sp. 5B2Z-1 TaxID=3132744 RepID=UPI00309FE74C